MVDVLCQLVCCADVRLGDSRVDMLDGSQVWGDGLLRVSSLRPQWLSVEHLFAEHCKNVCAFHARWFRWWCLWPAT